MNYLQSSGTMVSCWFIVQWSLSELAKTYLGTML
jgi:hypothetical protein